MDDAGLDNVDAELIFLLEFHFFELRQNIPVGRTEGKVVDFIDADPAQVVVLQALRGILCLCPKKGQADGDVRVGVHQLHENFLRGDLDAQFFQALADECLRESFTRLYLAADKFPQHTSCLVGRALAD